MTLTELLTALNGTEIPFTAYRWDKAPAAPYGTAQLEGGADSAAGDGTIIQQAIRGSIDLYAPNHNSRWPQAVQTAINGQVAWRLNSVQYEDAPRLVHYEWIFETEGL